MNGLDTFEDIKKATKNNKKAEVPKLVPALPAAMPAATLTAVRKTRAEFVEELSVSILMALIEHSGKCLSDYVDIAVDRAKLLANELGYDD